MIRFFGAHPTAANILVILLVVLGLSKAGQLQRDTFPDFGETNILVTVIYPGATPLDVEESICRRLEDAVDGLPGTAEIRCEALESLARMEVEADPDASIPRLLVDIKTQVDAIDDFPAEIEPPTVEEKDWADPVISVAAYGELTLPELKAYAEDFKTRLKRHPDISLVEINDFSDHQFRIELSLDKLREHQLSITDIAGIVGKQNIRLPSGTIDSQQRSYLVRFDDRRLQPQQLQAIIVGSSAEGGEIRLGDIATISDRFEREEQQLWVDGKPATLLAVKKSDAEDTLRVLNAVEEMVAQERQRMGDRVQLALTNDLASLVKDRLTMILDNAQMGIVLVFLCMWLFFSWRYSFWVAMGLPVSFLGGLFVMYQLGMTINVMSLVGLLVAIGILVDDAVVIAESIAAEIDRGSEPLDAVVNGTRRVLPGVMSSFATTMVVFGGLLFLDGMIGTVISQVPAALILVLSISLIEAFLILPAHLYHSLQHPEKQHQSIKLKRQFNASFEQFRQQQLITWLETIIRHRYAFLGALMLTFFVVLSLLIGGVLKFRALPDIDGDVIEARILLPQGTRLSQTKTVVAQIVAAADAINAHYTPDQPGRQSLIRHTTVLYNHNLDAFERGEHLATVRLDLLTADQRSVALDPLLNEWRQRVGRIPGVAALAFKQPALGPAGRPFEIELSHDDLDTLANASAQLQAWLLDYPGAVDILDDLRPGKEEIVLSLRDGAGSFGVDAQIIASQLRGIFFGLTADEIQIGPENIEIDVRIRDEDKIDLANFQDLPIILADGRQVPLGSVATVAYKRNVARINRINGQRTVTIYGDIDREKGNLNEALALAYQTILPQLQQQYPGLNINMEGEAKEGTIVGQSLRGALLFGLLAIFLMLALQFQGYLAPFIVMAVIPFTFTGIILGHLLLGFDLSMPSIMGFISLAGIVINDAILLVHYIRQNLRAGMEVEQAAINASRERFRAVLITSLTTTAGLIPMMFETSLQAQIIQPLVISIIFGVITATSLVIFLVPVLYTIFHDQGWIRSKQSNSRPHNEKLLG